MSKRNRLILLLTCLFLFLAAAPLTVFYSQGYRFDFGNKRLTQTGGIFLKVVPRQADVYLDGKLAKKTDFLFGSVLIENLLPESYQVRVEKEGYFPWEKTFEVREKEVSEAKFISLIPDKNNFSVLSAGTEDFWVAPDGKKIILREKETQGWTLKLYDIEKNLKSRLIEEKEISRTGADLMDSEWSADSKEIYLNIGAKEQEKNFVLRLDRIPPVLTERKTEETPENILAFSDGYYLDNRGFVLKFSDNSKLNQIPFPVQQETEYKLRIFDDFIFLSEGKTLYLLNKELNSFERIFEEARSLTISPDKRKLAVSTNSEIWIFFLKDFAEQPLKKAGNKLFLLRLSEKIGNVFWLNDYYLVFNSGDKIKIAEIDERDRIQTWDIANFPDPKMIFDKMDKKLYILSEKNLYGSQQIF